MCRAGKGVNIVIKYPVKTTNWESEEDVSSSDEDLSSSWDTQSDRETYVIPSTSVLLILWT